MEINAARQGAQFKDSDAKAIAKVLQKKFPNGTLTAKEVLEFARPKSSPIHKYFNWDDSEAAEKYRLMQARQLITCIVVVVGKDTVRKYVTPVVIQETGKKAYVEISVARKTPYIWDQVLQRALDEALLWKARYETITKLSPIVKAIEKTEKILRKKK